MNLVEIDYTQPKISSAFGVDPYRAEEMQGVFNVIYNHYTDLMCSRISQWDGDEDTSPSLSYFDIILPHMNEAKNINEQFYCVWCAAITISAINTHIENMLDMYSLE